MLDQPSRIIEPDGATTRLEYDSRLRLVRSTDARGAVTRYEYDARGDLTALTDASGNRTVFVFDGNRRLIRRESPTVLPAKANGVTAAVEVTLFGYDLAGRLVREEKVSASGGASQVIELAYDDLDRLVRRSLKREQGGAVVETQDEATFAYSRQLDASLMLSADNRVAKLSFTREHQPPYAMTGYSVQAAESGNPLGLIEEQFTLGRDVTGEIASVQGAALGELVSALYDPAGRLIRKTGRLGSLPALQFDLAYDTFGRKAQVSSSTGLVGSYQYDPLNRVSSIQWNGADGTGRNLGIGQSLTYGHLSGNIIQVAREFGQFTYGYDSTHQLVRSSYAGSVALPGEIVNRSLSFDLTGNRIDDSTNGRGEVGAGNFLVSDKRTFYRPDPDGLGHVSQKISRVTGAVQSFGYGVDGLLSRYDDSSGKSARYFYDALGRRVAKRVLEAEPLAGGTPVTKMHAYLHLADEHRVLLAKGEGTGLGSDSELELFIDGPGIDEHLGKVAGTERVGFATDHLGSVLNSELSSAGAAAAAVGFGLWGEELGTAPTAGTSALIYGYTGREHDRESGLRYHRARQYDPSSGRGSSASGAIADATKS